MNETSLVLDVLFFQYFQSVKLMNETSLVLDVLFFQLSASILKDSHFSSWLLAV